MAAAAAAIAAVGDPERERAGAVVAVRLDLQHRRGRAGEVAEEAVRAVEAEVVGARVGQRDRELVAGADRVAVRRAGDRQRSCLEVNAEPPWFVTARLRLLRVGVEVDVEAVAEPARGPHARLLGRDRSRRRRRRVVGRGRRAPGRLVGGDAGQRRDASRTRSRNRTPRSGRRRRPAATGVMLGSSTPNRASMKRISDVWSNVSEQTQPPVLHGETTSSGTRTPRPYGPTTPFEPPGVPAVPLNSSLSSGTVDCPASPPTLG